MEAYRKSNNRASLKGIRFVPFYRNAPKPSSTVQYTATNIKPNQYSSSPASVEFLVHQDYAITKKIEVADNRSNLDEGDESVDIKAEIYITKVLERFKAEQNTF
uniref:Uncharacterized protein n=1 Tax=Cajanus cajan TaxID=3821 RepID=A0A151SPU8_CAJCA|nr:hypothetical protein KK1_003103 [Cajanus cajan]